MDRREQRRDMKPAVDITARTDRGRQPRPARVLAGLGLALGLVLVAGCNGDDKATSLGGSGTIEASTMAVTTEMGGRVAEVEVDVGDMVAEGQTLVTLDPALIDSQLAEAEAGLDGARAALDQVRLGAGAAEVKAAFATLLQAFAQRDAARVALEQARLTAAGAGVGDSALAEAEGALRQAEVTVAAARAAYETMRSGPTDDEIAAAEAAVRQAEAARDLLQARRDKLTLAAPMAGRVVERAIEPGEIAAPGAVLLRLADLSEVTVTAYVPEPDIGQVELGQRATVTVDAYPDDDFEGRVEHIATEAEFTPRNVQTEADRANLVFAVRVRLANEGEELRPGMPADVEIDVD